MLLCAAALGADEALLAVSDQILSAQLRQSLADEVGVGGAVILQKGALKLLFVIIGGNVDLLHIKGIYPRVEHYRRRRSGCGVEILHLLGGVSVPFETESEIQGIFECRAGVA